MENKTLTAVEWLFEELNIWQTIADEDTNATLDTVRKLLEQAKKMEKENIKKKKNKDWSEQCKCKDSIGQTWCCNMCGLPFDTRKGIYEYKNEQSQKEISDEEIRKQAIKYDNQAFSETPIAHFIEGAKWYREQLKKNKL